MMIYLGIILLTLALGLWLLRRYLIHGQMTVKATYTLDGVVQHVTLHFGSKYPKLWGHQGTYAGRGDLCFRSYPVGYPAQVVGVPSVHLDLIAHELVHDAERIRMGWFKFWREAWWMLLSRKYKNRPFEQRAIAGAALIMAGTYPGVDAAELLRRFA